MDFSDPSQPNVEAQLSLPLGVPTGKKKRKISAATKRVRSPASERESEAILVRILEHVRNVQNENKEPSLKELNELLADTFVEDSPLADASVKLEALNDHARGVSLAGNVTSLPVGNEAGSPRVELDNESPAVGLSSSELVDNQTPRVELQEGEDSIEAPQATQSAEQSFAPDSEGSSRLESGAVASPVESAAPPTTDDVLANADEINSPSDGIEILVRMAKQGELDPKAVDIVDVTDRFLKLISSAPKENLRQSGKILFHACVLLRMKAEALLSYTSDDDDPVGDDFMDFEDGDGSMDSENMPRQITFADLEKAIVRRTQRRRVRPRPVTLDDLISALREAERLEKVRAEKKPKSRIDLAGQHSVEGMDDLLDLAHDEDIETTIEQVEQLLAQILKFGENIELMKLVGMLGSQADWVDAFLASLFLSNAGKIYLEQSEFYGPLYIALGEGQTSAANT